MADVKMASADRRALWKRWCWRTAWRLPRALVL